LDDPTSLDFRGTLDLLAGWQRRRVTVTAYHQRTHDRFPGANVRMHGRLGEARLGGARHPSNPPISLLTTASYPIGPARAGDSPRNSFQLRDDDLVATRLLTNSTALIECCSGIIIEVRLD
jgi:hypothetical protein